MSPSDDSGQRITARPGTSEYDAQFEKQAQSAADGVLRHWFIRVPCAVFALGNVAAIIESIFVSAQPILSLIWSIVWMTLLTIECGSIALGRKSFYFRFCLSGVPFRSRITRIWPSESSARTDGIS